MDISIYGSLGLLSRLMQRRREHLDSILSNNRFGIFL